MFIASFTSESIDLSSLTCCLSMSFCSRWSSCDCCSCTKESVTSSSFFEWSSCDTLMRRKLSCVSSICCFCVDSIAEMTALACLTSSPIARRSFRASFTDAEMTRSLASMCCSNCFSVFGSLATFSAPPSSSIFRLSSSLCWNLACVMTAVSTVADRLSRSTAAPIFVLRSSNLTCARARRAVRPSPPWA